MVKITDYYLEKVEFNETIINGDGDSMFIIGG